MTARDHSKLLGIFFAINAGLQAFGVLICVLIYGGLGVAMIANSRRDEDQILGVIFLVAMVFVFLFSLVLIIPQALAALKLIKRKSGARFWAIFAAIVALFGFPLGTALGVYALWFLFGDAGKNYFTGNSEFSPPPPPNSWQ